MQITPLAIAVLAIELAPAAAFGFAAGPIIRTVQRCPATLRVLLPAILVIPYVVIAATHHMFHWQWLALYAALPVVIAWLLTQASRADPRQLGNWRDALILLALGIAVDLRWLDSAWPRGLEALGKLLLVDAGLYGFLAIRQLEGTGFDFRPRWLEWKTDWKIGLRELLYFAPFVLALGLTLGFIRPHANYPAVWQAILRWAEIFVFIAIPEELFFRAWVQNLLERRMGRRAALVIASVLFGLSHFNKRNPVGRHFNLPYVILATIAGIFYGRAWRQNRRVPTSAITHTCVDWLWSFWF
jgi:membrane protease YdiL (CAAX protease family)